MNKKPFCPNCGKRELVKKQKGGLIKTYICENKDCNIYFKFDKIESIRVPQNQTFGRFIAAGVFPPAEITIKSCLPPAETKHRILNVTGESNSLLKLFRDTSNGEKLLKYINQDFIKKGISGKFNIENGTFKIDE